MRNTRNPMIMALEAISGRMVGDLGNNRSAVGMQGEVNRLRLRAEQLDNVAINRNPLDTEEAHAVKVARLARTLDKDITATINRAGDHFREGRQDLRRRIEEKVNYKPDKYEGVILSRFVTLSRKDQMSLISRLVGENRGSELAAILQAPFAATGLTDQERATLENSLFSAHAAGELEELEKLEGVFEAVTAATTATSGYVRDLTDPGKLAKIESQAANAEKATEAFNQAAA